jgi:hypothetical protein
MIFTLQYRFHNDYKTLGVDYFSIQYLATVATFSYFVLQSSVECTGMLTQIVAFVTNCLKCILPYICGYL